MLVGGPRILALVGYDPAAGLPIRRPCLPNSGTRCRRSRSACRRLDERKGERAAIAQALDAGARGQDGPAIRRSSMRRQPRPSSTRTGRATFGRCAPCLAPCWPRTGTTSPSRAPRSRRNCSACALPLPRPAMSRSSGLRALLDRMLEEGGFSLSEFERSAYQAAVDRTAGNLSAAARLLGLTRAQLAYRIGARDGPT